MSLFRQIAALISIFLVLLLAATTWNNFRHSSQAMEGQLKNAAQNMATTLGIAVTNSVQGTEPSFVETLFNVAFDSGHLAKIELISVSGEQLNVKEQTVTIRKVPNWLVQLVPLAETSGESRIMKNWKPYGTIRLTMHPGYVYAGIYENLKSILFWFTTVTIIGLFILWILLHMLLHPLLTIQDQAEAICDNRFIQNEQLPRTAELRSVARAMNRMVEKVKNVYAEQAESITRYHTQLYQDALTGLGNRRHLMLELDKLCGDEAASHGCLVVIHLHGLTKIKDRIGYRDTDRLVVALARLIEEAAGQQDQKYCARIHDTEFVMHIGSDFEMAEVHTQQVFKAFRRLAKKESIDELTWLCAGLAIMIPDSSPGSLLSEVDFALTQAKASGAYTTYSRPQSELDLPQGKMQWRTWLEDALKRQRFFLVTQPVLRGDGKIDHREVYVRLRDEQGRIIPAGIFMPMANGLGLDYAIETDVFRMILASGNDHTRTETQIAVNISSSFITDGEALASLDQFIRISARSNQIKLCIEASHFTLIQHPQAAEALNGRIRDLGCRFGIDNLDLSLPLDILHILRPSYIKANARVLEDTSKEQDSTGLKNLLSLTNSLDVDLIAVGIDSQEILDTMHELTISTVQGNHIGSPQELA